VLGGTATVQGTAGDGVFYNTFVFGATTGAHDIYSVTVTNTNATARQVIASAICGRVAG
jgi:hypothetical protein